MPVSNNRYYTSTEETLSVSADAPLSYIDWLKYETTFDRSTAFEEYTKYLNQWYNKKGIDSKVVQQQYIKSIYTELLKQISLEYTTADEKRFLKNIDYSNQHDLDIALPFFAKKLKQIAIYYANQRDEIKFSKIKANLKGSSYGLNQIIYKQISEMINYDPTVSDQLADMGLTAQDVLTNLKIESQELYDTEQNYYNIPTSENVGTYTGKTTKRYNYFDASILPDRSKMFLEETLNETIVETIREIPVIMESGIESENNENVHQLMTSTGESLGITDIITGTELDRLDDTAFDNYLQTGDLNITYEQLAFQKYSGTDYYYLSTGDSATEVVSGKLFSAQHPHREILNKFYPTLLPVQGENVYREEFVGGFFTTSGVGLQTYSTLDFKFYFKPTEKNSIHFFPDPASGAAGFFSADVPYETVVEYFENVNWQKSSIVTHYNYGLQRQITNITKFSPYQSVNDTIGTEAGVFKTDDNFDFWSHDGSNTWMNEDIYPVEADSYTSIQNIRQDELHTQEETIYTWKTDVYGNRYALSKQEITPRKPIPVNTGSTLYDTMYKQYDTVDFNNKGTNINLTDTEFHKNKNLTEQSLIYGNVLIKNNTSTGVQQLTSASVSGLYDKYMSTGTINYRDTSITIGDIGFEIENRLQDIDIVYDNIIFNTENYIIFEKISYDYETGIITSGHKNFAFIYKNYHQHGYEKTSNWWYDEQNSRFLVVKTTIHPSLSGTTNKMIYPEVFSYNTSEFQVKKVYPDNDYTEEQLVYETGQYSLSAINNYNIIDITEVSEPKLTYNNESERYTLLQLGKDTAENLYMLKTDFLLYDMTVGGVKPTVYKNSYTTYTVNPRNESIRPGFFSEINPPLQYINFSKYTYYHDYDRQLLFMGAIQDTSGDPERPRVGGIVIPSGCNWIHGTLPQNMQTERDIVMCFDFTTCGTLTNPALKPHGVSVVFFNARVIDVVNTNVGVSEPEYEILDTGGLGSAFGYLDDTTHGTNTQPSLSGLDSGHACVALDVVGKIGNDTSAPANNITVFGPYQESKTFIDTQELDTAEFNMYSDLSLYSDYSNLPFIRCKVTLTDVARKITVHMKNLNTDQDFQLVREVDISGSFEPSRVTYSGDIYKCIITHVSTASTPDSDTRVTYDSQIYRCLKNHDSRTTTPDEDTLYWVLDNEWTVNTPAAWSSGGTYVASQWLVENTYTGTAPTWAGTTRYTSKYITPDRVKAALVCNQSATNSGFVVIKNITVTGAGNDV